MADLAIAVDFVLRQEDSTLAGVVTHTRGDPGGATRWGISERWHPELVKTGFYDVSRMSAYNAKTVAERIYVGQYAAPLQLFEINSQMLANRLLSFAVNEGPAQAVKIFQRALEAIVPGYGSGHGGENCVDGVLGVRTLAALNAADPVELQMQVASEEAAFYRSWVAQSPARQHLLAGLLARANA